MMTFGALWILGVLFVTVVAPIWIIAHYLTRWRSSKSLSNEDESLLAELWESADRLDGRIRTIERILDAEGSDWRSQA